MTSCGGSPTPISETFDFAGIDMAIGDLAEDLGDAGEVGTDLAGYELTCDPGTSLSGGDPVGAWSYYAACASPEALFQLQAVCPTITIGGMKLTGTSGGGEPNGTLHLFEDGTFNNTTFSHLYANAVVPPSCYASTGNCGQYGTTQSDQFNWLDMKCQTSGATCSCTISFDASIQENGTWARTADGFSTSAALNGTQNFSATATSNTLHERGDASSVRGKRGITYVLIR
ncbi:MAG: hypothetical protein ABI445_15990 [Polyangia bacterium]